MSESEEVNFEPTLSEFFENVNKLYPDQSARIIAEIRAAKMYQYIEQNNMQESAEPTSEAQ